MKHRGTEAQREEEGEGGDGKKGKDRWGGGRFGRRPKTYISVYSVSLCFQMTRGLGGFLKHRGTEAQRKEEGKEEDGELGK